MRPRNDRDFCKECGGAGRGGGPYGEHQELRGRDDMGSELSAAGGRMKRDERVAAVKISSARRKAAQKFWAPQQDHRPLRKGFYAALKTKSPPAFAKDDALHRGTTLLRGLLTQAAL